jgi:hypothetical protein
VRSFQSPPRGSAPPRLQNKARLLLRPPALQGARTRAVPDRLQRDRARRGARPLRRAPLSRHPLQPHQAGLRRGQGQRRPHRRRPGFVRGKSRPTPAWRPDNPADKSTELVEVFECYVQVDYDGDGVAEWRKIVMVGGPGRALASSSRTRSGATTCPSQRHRAGARLRIAGGAARSSTRSRTFSASRPCFAAGLGQHLPRQQPASDRDGRGVANPDVLAKWKIGDTIFGRRRRRSVRAGAVDRPARRPVLEMMDAVSKSAPACRQATMALDMDALQNQTATAVNANQAAAHTKIEEYARNIAECGGLQRSSSPA